MAAANKPTRTYFLGDDACLCWSPANSIGRLTSLQVLFVYRHLKADKELPRLGVHDLVPS